MARRRRKYWSYNAGERSENWVRVFEKPGRPSIYMEWRDDGRTRNCSLRHNDRQRAKDQARGLAERFEAMENTAPEPMSVGRLLNLYLKEVTPNKKKAKQGHDRTAAEMFRRLLGEDTRVEALGVVEFQRFIELRRSGALRPLSVDRTRPVGDRIVEYDLKFMRAVFNWGCVAKAGGSKPHLSHNPWKGDGFVIPKERSPARPSSSPEMHRQMLEHAPNWRCSLALIIGRHTRSRNSSVRHLRWSDLDFSERLIRWQSDYQKDGKTAVTPMPDAVFQALRDARVPRGIGDAWVFPSVTDPSEPTSRHSFQIWLRRAKERCLRAVGEDEQERTRLRKQLKGVGYHAEKRAGVRDPGFRQLPAPVRAALARTTVEVLDQVYDEIDIDTMRAAEISVQKEA